MPVVEAGDGQMIVPNFVYVIPAGKDMTMVRGMLKLAPRPSSGPHLPINLFLDSLARDRKTEAIAVILSGTAADGAEGVQAVKIAGGMTLVQEPATAKYPSMPDSAIATGAVDFVLPIALLARQLVAIAQHSGPQHIGRPVTGEEASLVVLPDDPDVAEVLALVRAATSADFTHYKQSTVLRRITRRLMLRDVPDLRQYADLLRKDPAELEALYQDLLIRVTSFFRQPQVFEALTERFFHQLKGTRAGEQVRFWVPGCATGEEAYSLAIAWAEYAGGTRLDRTSLQIFASDINQKVIDKARSGVYPASIVSDVSPERLARFFTPVENGYQIVKDIRDTCVFAKHDLTRDPPFSKLDLISVRNVLIYLGPLLQQRVMHLLHFALVPGGLLLLGESESIGRYPDLFSLVDKKARLYTRRNGLAALAPNVPTPITRGEATPIPSAPSKEFDPSEEADRIVLEKYAPVGVIVDANLNVRQFRGRTGAYLELGPGRVTSDLLRLARQGLSSEIARALREATKAQMPLRRENIRILRNDQAVVVGFDVVPLKSASEEALFLVLFHDMPSAGEEESGLELTRPPDTPDDATRMADLERDLSDLREYARAVLEDKESANEELRSANEELQSGNEELQSLNEELETASEEVQSANEELRTLNEELHSLNDQFARVNDELRDGNARLQELNAALESRELDLKNARDYARTVIDTVREPLVVLGPDLRVVSANPSFHATFDTSAAETLGQPFFELEAGQWDGPELREAIQRASAEGADFQDLIVERDFARLGRRTMLLSGRSIHTGKPGVANLLLAVENITERAREEASLRLTQLSVDRSADLVHWVAPDGRVLYASDSSCQRLGYSHQEILAATVFDLDSTMTPEIWPKHRQELKSRGSMTFESVHRTKQGEFFPVEVSVSHMESGGEEYIVAFARDITERKRTEEALRESEERYRSLFEHMLEGFAYCQMLYGDDGRPLDWIYLAVNRAFGELTGLEDVVGKKVTEIFPGIREESPELFDIYARVACGGKSERFEIDFTPISKWLDVGVSSPREGYFVAVFQDVTERKRAEEEQRGIAQRLQEALLDIPQQASGVEFGHLYRSATQGASVGGDFHDVFRVKAGRLAVLIGDVSGHGVEAARIATLVKDVVHAFAHQFRRPSVILGKTNELLIEKQTPGFVTLFLGILDPEDGTLTYASAGHPNALLREGSGEVELLEAGSLPLGIFDKQSWKESRIQLEDQDLLFLYTDGVIEARRDGEFFGQEGLMEVLKRWSERSPELLPEAVLAEVLAFSGGVLTDDVAMLALRLTEDVGRRRAKKEGRQEKPPG